MERLLRVNFAVILALMSLQTVEAQEFTRVFNHEKPDLEWILYGKLYALAELITFYPDRRLVFLARDAEYLYLLATLLDSSKVSSKKYQLLTLNTAILADQNLKEYLIQEKIPTQPSEVTPNDKIIFIDVGINGTIPKLYWQMTGLTRREVPAHMIWSFHGGIPSARVGQPPDRFQIVGNQPSFGGLIRDTSKYELLPHSTSRADHLVLSEQGKWIPSSTKEHDPSRIEAAEEFRIKILQWGSSAEVKKTFGMIKSAMRALVTAQLDPNNVSSYRITLAKNTLKKFGLLDQFLLDLSDVTSKKQISPQEHALRSTRIRTCRFVLDLVL